MSRKRKYKKKKFKIFSWKALDKRFRIMRKLRLLGIAVLVAVVTAGTYVSVYLYQSFRKPFVRAEGGPEIPFSWQAGEPKTFAWLVSRGAEHTVLESAAVLYLDPQRGRAVLVGIPIDDLSLSHGVSSCLSTVSKKMSVPVNGYFLVENKALEDVKLEDSSLVDWKEWDFGTLFKFPSLVKAGKGHFWSNLSAPEILRVTRFILSTREDQRIKLKVEEGEDIQEIVGSFFSDKKIETEGARVLVLNGTTVPELAGNARVWLENWGCFILDVGNAPQQNHKESLILASDMGSYTVQRLVDGLKIEAVKELDPSLSWAKRADIVVILGIDKKGFF